MVAHAKVPFKSYSQAGQDIFAHTLIGDTGTYLEIGANGPVVISNTYALEKLGWAGLSCDNSGVSMEAFERERKNFFYLTDAAAPQNWQAALAQAGLPTDHISFLSLDIDSSTLECLRNLPLNLLKFGVITIETDRYRFGDAPRDEMRRILYANGYDLICGDVMDAGLEFEDWWVHPEIANMDLANKFRCNGADWRYVLSKGSAPCQKD
jgi:hypothetical protein